MSKYFKHTIHVIALFATIALAQYLSFRRWQVNIKNGQLHNELSYLGTALQLVLIILIGPQILCNIFGLVLSNTFPGDVKLNLPGKNEPKSNGVSNGYKNGISHNNDIEATVKPNIATISSPSTPTDPSPTSAPLPSQPFFDKGLDLPHLCFRIVTKGLYPDLVQDNVRKNFLTCINSGISNFSIEIVTDIEMPLLNVDQRIKQLVVPNEYRTSTGALFKARALQYALEPGVSLVEDSDYLVHLDEETIITKNCVYGILNFALEGKHDFGQGLITYANLEIVNLFTTLADSLRVAEDMGKLRFTLGTLHKPIFAWKGSFVVARCGAEKDVSFDQGPDGSIAEDFYFAMVAYQKGYTFDFIQGEMYEKSPFTIMDLIRQRKRWLQGTWLVVHSSKIPIKTKFFAAMSHYTWLTSPISTFGYILMSIYALETHYWLQPIGTLYSSTIVYMYMFGLVKSFDLKKGSYGMLFVYLIGQVLTLSFTIVIETTAVVWGIFSPKHNFYIVKKEVGSRVIPDA